MPPLQTHLTTATARLAAAGVETPALDARLLMAHALNCDRAALLTRSDQPLTPEQAATFEQLLTRRAAREPIARILGLREFWSLPFGLNEATLDPRPDSETLIAAALELYKNPPPKRILDLGTGTGCLLLALLHEFPEATGLGLDLAPRALEQARANATRLELETRARFQQSNWLEVLEPAASFDLIISNPPYIPSTEIPQLMPEVRNHDPLRALDGGPDGLAPYRELIPKLQNFLTPGGYVLFEIGYTQAKAVSALFAASSFTAITTHRDLAHNDRGITARKPA